MLTLHKVLKVSPDGSTITTFAGDGQTPTSLAHLGDGGPAVNARIDRPAGVSVDAQDNVYIVDNVAHRISKVTTDGILHIIAGSGSPVSGLFGGAFSGDGGSPLAARFNRPEGVHVAPDGSVYITDGSNNRVRKIAY